MVITISSIPFKLGMLRHLFVFQTTLSYFAATSTKKRKFIRIINLRQFLKKIGDIAFHSSKLDHFRFM